MDLGLVPVDILLAEIDKRYDAFVMCSSKDGSSGDVFDWHMSGNHLLCLGLVTKLQRELIDGVSVTETGEMGQDLE